MKLTLLHLFCFAILNLLVILFGYSVLKKKAVLLSWLMMATALLITYVLFANEHPVIKMLGLIATTFTGMKVIAATEEYKNKALTLKFRQWFIFAACWAGMRAQPFETLGGPPLPNAWPMIRFGISRIIAGLLLIGLAHGMVALHLNQTFTYISVSVVLLVGLSLILHFGLLSISAGAWRLHGVNTYYLFRQPAKALSLTEFWSKRWNIAFSEMTSIALFRPLKNKTGSPVALMIAFIFSGLLHEIALSLPVNSGYGLPTLYFVIQGTMVLTEKLMVSNKVTFLKNTSLARLWTFFWIDTPMPLLFHEQFIRQVVWPLAGLGR